MKYLKSAKGYRGIHNNEMIHFHKNGKSLLTIRESNIESFNFKMKRLGRKERVKRDIDPSKIGTNYVFWYEVEKEPTKPSYMRFKKRQHRKRVN